LGPIEHLANHEYWTLDIYGPNTQHPEIRSEILRFLKDNPSEPFREFLFYTIGEFDTALRLSSRSLIEDTLHYAIAHKMLEGLLFDTITIVKGNLQTGEDDYTLSGVSSSLNYLNSHPALYNDKPLALIVPNFAARAEAAKPHFEFVLRIANAHHADDAAYMLGWLAFHQGKTREALTYLSRSMSVGNGDYAWSAVHLTLQVLARYSAREQITAIESDSKFAEQPLLWYVVARSIYRNFDYALTIEAGERALRALKIAPDSLPATTSPERILEAL
jgi:tetratricopeptide (TPR) repeat protein